VLVVGAGAAGLELAFAFKTRFTRRFGAAKVTIICKETEAKFLADRGTQAKALVLKSLKLNKIDILFGETIVGLSKDSLTTASGKVLERQELVVWATGAAPPEVLKSIDVPKSSKGYLAVDKTLLSDGSPWLFAVGDCAEVRDAPSIRRAGVFAVREAPILAQNLKEQIRKIVERDTDSPRDGLVQYEPQSDFLSLLNTCDGSAIGSKYGKAWQGKHVFWQKNHIDLSFMYLFGSGEANGFDEDVFALYNP
jgi:selenide,water dikinase